MAGRGLVGIGVHHVPSKPGDEKQPRDHRHQRDHTPERERPAPAVEQLGSGHRHPRREGDAEGQAGRVDPGRQALDPRDVVGDEAGHQRRDRSHRRARHGRRQQQDRRGRRGQAEQPADGEDAEEGRGRRLRAEPGRDPLAHGRAETHEDDAERREHPLGGPRDAELVGDRAEQRGDRAECRTQVQADQGDHDDEQPRRDVAGRLIRGVGGRARRGRAGLGHLGISAPSRASPRRRYASGVRPRCGCGTSAARGSAR